MDDEPDLLAALKRLLERMIEGARVQTALSAGEGLQVLDSHKPTVVVSDLNMPGMDGITFLTHVQRLVPDTLRILYTGARYPGLELVARQACGALVLQKDQDAWPLVDVVQYFLREDSTRAP